MYFKLLKFTMLKTGPSLGSDDLNVEIQEDSVGRVINTNGDNWLEMAFLLDGSKPAQGWLRKKGNDNKPRVEEVDAPPPRAEISEWAFVKSCISAEYWINKPLNDDGTDSDDNNNAFFVAADYLLAWAIIETNNQITRQSLGKNSLPTDGIGPFQLSSQDWKTFTDSPYGHGYIDLNREVHLDQIAGAAFVARKAILDISAAIDQHDGNIKIEPYIPSYMDVLLAHMFGTPFATKCRKLKFANKADEAVKTILEGIHGATNTTIYIEDRDKFLKNQITGEIETIDGMYINTNKILTSAFEKAFEKIQEFAPEDAAVDYKDGSANWYADAKIELDDWKDNLGDENSDAGRGRIFKYFDKIDYETDSNAKVPHWCGAFAGFCVNQATNTFKNVKGPAKAANWVSFGNVSISVGDPKPPVGAVVVLSPDAGSSTSGHVGFFSHYSEADPNIVFLLGGNQKDTVQISKFARSKIKTIRWASPKKSADDETNVNTGNLSEGPYRELLDFIGFYESNNNYNAFYGNTKNQTNPEITAMSVSQVQTFQDKLRNANDTSSATGKYQFMYDTLGDLIRQKKVARSEIFSNSIQDKLAVDLLLRRSLKAFLNNSISENKFALNLSKEWASLPVPFNTTGHKGRKINEGQSYYAGDGINKALVPLGPFLDAIRKIKNA